MYISLRIKLFLMFLFILGTCFIPSYVVLRNSHQAVLRELEHKLAKETMAGTQRFSSLDLSLCPAEQCGTELASLGKLHGTQATLLWGPFLQTAPQVEPEAEEITKARDSIDSHGSSIRKVEGKGYHLFVAKAFYDAKGKMALLRQELSIDDTVRSFRRSEWVLIGSCVMAGVFSVFFLIGFIYFFLRPIRRIKQSIQSFSEGNYHHAQPMLRIADELGELQAHLSRFAKHMQDETLRMGLDHAAWEELIRVLPVGMAVLRSNFGMLHINTLFRDGAHIDSATEHVKFHELSRCAAFLEAVKISQEKRIITSLQVRLSWLLQPLHLTLAPLPQAGGQVAWALFLVHADGIQDGKIREAIPVLQQVIETLDKVVQRDPSEYEQDGTSLWMRARFAEMRVASDLLQTQLLAVEEPVSAASSDVLLACARTDLSPMLIERTISLQWNVSETAHAQVAEQGKTVERVLRAALCRAIKACPLLPLRQRTTDLISSTITVQGLSTERWVVVVISDLPAAVDPSDLDRLLHPLGGCVRDSALPQHSHLASNAQTNHNGKGGHALWLYLRKA